MKAILRNKDNLNTFKFLKSAYTENNPFISTESVVNWLREQNKSINVQIKKIPIKDLISWSYDEHTGSIKHESGKFFSIEGIRVKTNWGIVPEWEQPIINQPEIGYLGLITREFEGVLCFLMQAKIEPGNINYVQLSPTLQATRSNFQQVHRGKKPLFLEYFQNATPDQILLDQLQSEQGARFLHKRNRNIIIQLDDDITIPNNFIWLTLGQIKKLMQLDNLINMDTRTVISGIPFGSFDSTVIDVFNLLEQQNQSNLLATRFLSSALSEQGAMHSIEEIISFITKLKSEYDLFIEKVDIKKMSGWTYNGNQIQNHANKYFRVIGAEIEIGNREVVKWTQPMVAPAQEGLCAFICKEINGIMHFIVQAKLECGNFDIFELAPTVQCLTGNYRQTKQGTLPFLDYILNVDKEHIVIDTMQSEEGGRFFREQNRNMIVIGNDLPLSLPENYIWMTLNQLYTFLRFNNYLNIQSRSLLAAISFI